MKEVKVVDWKELTIEGQEGILSALSQEEADEQIYEQPIEVIGCLEYYE